jgi:hypothetical protein
VKRAARLVALVGAIAVGWLLFGGRPRDVVLVYDASAVPDATAVEVDLRQGGSFVRHARILVHPGEQAHHPVRLRDGAYELAWRVERPSGALTGERTIEVNSDQTIVLPLGR